MKKVCLNLSESRALGDTLCSTPTIRKLYSSYNQKISVITHHKEIFKNNQYVDVIFGSNIDMDILKDEYEIFKQILHQILEYNW